MTDKQQIMNGSIVCPECFVQIPGTKVLPTQINRYHTEFRTYLGYCTKCSSGYEVIQFKKKDHWLINKYQKYPIKQIGSDGGSLLGPMNTLPGIVQCRPSGKWTTLYELPEPAPVLTGPGEEYDEGFTPETSELLGKLQKALNCINQAIECLIRHFQK